MQRTRRQDYEELLQEERLLSRELDTYTQHFEPWDNHREDHATNSTMAAGATVPPAGHVERGENEGPLTIGGGGEERGEDDEAEVERINLRIAREGGATGGWHPQEHEMFLQVWAQVRGFSPKDIADDASIATLQDRYALVLRERRCV